MIDTRVVHPDHELRQWTFADHAELPRGIWQREPDKMQWVDRETGLDCLIHRNRSGALCGYVGVPESHPYFGKEYSHMDFDVHGGLTYSDFCQERPADCGEEGEGICHVPYAGRAEHVWWLGFDCAHGFDVSPKYRRRFGGAEEVYRDIGYVMRQCASLAKQLSSVQ